MLLAPVILTFLIVALILTNSLIVLSTVANGSSKGSIGGILSSGMPFTRMGMDFSKFLLVHSEKSGSDLWHIKFDTRSAAKYYITVESFGPHDQRDFSITVRVLWTMFSVIILSFDCKNVTSFCKHIYVFKIDNCFHQSFVFMERIIKILRLSQVKYVRF